MTKKFYEDLRGLTPNPILTEDDLRKELQTEHTFVSFDRLRSYTQELLTSGKIEEVFLSYEEIENLLTEEQNQISFDTYPPYELDDYDYDHSLRVFTVPYSWYLKWLEENYFVPETSNRDDDDYFHAEYIWDDTMLMYDCALEDGVVIKEEIIPR